MSFNFLKRKLLKKLGKLTARRVLSDFRELQRRHSDLSKEELYYLTILKSPGYTEDFARRIIDSARKFDDVERFGLQSIAKRMFTHEQMDMLDSPLSYHDFRNWNKKPTHSEAWEAIEDAISDSL